MLSGFIPSPSSVQSDDVVLSSLTFVMPGLGAGGSEHVVSMLANHYVSTGVRVRLACFQPFETKPYYALDPEICLVNLGSATQPRNFIGRTLTMARRYRSLKNELSDNPPDVVVSFLTRTNVLASLAANALNIPVIVSERNNPDRQRVGATWSAIRRYAYRRSDALVTMTRGASAYFAPARRRADVVIPNHAVATRWDRTFDASGRNLVAVGRLVEQKGFDLLLQAFAAIAPRFPDWRLTIWGEGPLRRSLERQRSALGLDRRVSFPGVTREPGGWTADADLFVLSSRYEGWGIVVGEAMAAGIPTVAFDCPWGPAEMIEHEQTGLLAPDQDVAGLAEQLAAAMADPALRQRLGSAGKQAMERFLPERIIMKWDGLIKRVAARARASAPHVPQEQHGVIDRSRRLLGVNDNQGKAAR